MKSRHSPNLYEILRSAAGPRDAAAPATAVAAPPAPPPPPVVQEPEPVVEAPPPPPAPPPPRVEPERIVAAPPPVAVERPQPEPDPAPGPGLGERSLKVTYNTILFTSLVVVGAIFLAFTLGVRTGRSQQVESGAVSPELTKVTPQAPAVPAPKFTIRLVEYRAPSSREYTAALDAAIRYKNELERLGWRDAVVETLGLTPERRVVLRYGEYPDAAAPAVRETLKKLKELKLDKKAKEPTFARTAQFQTR